jgi:hypothetical protein
MSDWDNYENPKEGKTYISPSLKSFGKGTEKVRIASKVIESRDSYAFGTIKDEVVLRHKEGAKSYIKAKFIEEPRGLFLLNIQGYTIATDKPHNAIFSFLGSEIEKLLEFIQNILSVSFKVNALMKTKGIISSLCFIEIKTHETPLLQNKPYRFGCWAPSQDLTGAVAQIQGTVASAVKSLTQKISFCDELGNPTGEEAYNYLPKSYLVISSLGEFTNEHGVNEDKYRSFELYRKNIIAPEILTFDELYERTKYIVEYDAS